MLNNLGKVKGMTGLDFFIEYAVAAGLPKDTLKRFIAAQYIPQPKQLQFHVNARIADEDEGPTEVGYGGARGGGKTHCGFGQIAIDDCQRFDNLKVLFLRKVGNKAEEGLNDLRLSMLRNVNVKYSRGVFQYPNHSRIIAGHYQYEKDIDNYLSLEYDIIWIEQAEQITGKKIDLIKTVNRSSKGFRPRMYYTFNPGGVSHQYLKHLFIDPWRVGPEKEQELFTRFTFATVDDNYILNDTDPQYRRTLEKLTGWQREAWLNGNWDIAAGQFFSNWRYDRVVRNFPSPTRHQRVWCSMDYGYNHPTVVYLFAMRDGKIQVVDEVRIRKTLVPGVANAVKRMLSKHGVTLDRLETFVAGNDVFAQRGSSDGKTIADQYEDEGITLEQANEDRINGAAYILKLLGSGMAEGEADIPPMIEIHERCKFLIETLPYMQANPNRMEDVLKVDANEDGEGGDDEYDSARYGVMVHADLFGNDSIRDAMDWSGKGY